MSGSDEASSSINSEVSMKLTLSTPLLSEQSGKIVNSRVEEKINETVTIPKP